MNKCCRIPAVLYILHKLVLENFQNFEKNIYQKQKKILQNDYNIVTIIKCRQLKIIHIRRIKNGKIRNRY